MVITTKPHYKQGATNGAFGHKLGMAEMTQGPASYIGEYLTTKEAANLANTCKAASSTAKKWVEKVQPPSQDGPVLP